MGGIGIFVAKMGVFCVGSDVFWRENGFLLCWHPKCRCYKTAELAKREERIEYLKKIANGEDVSDFKFSGQVKDMPGNFNDWLTRNAERVKTISSVPYFVKDNTKYIPKEWINNIGSLKRGGNKLNITDLREKLIQLKDPTYITEKQVRDVVVKYSKENPNEFYGGLKKVVISRRNDDAMMANVRYYYRSGVYYKKDGNTINIYNVDFTVLNSNGEYVIFNPLHELKGAIKAIATGEKLALNQEYSIECLWHEIRHAGAVGWGNINNKSIIKEGAMECINQFCARHSYSRFLRALGGKATHKKEIISNGYGYGKSVRHFRYLLKVLNVSESEAYAYFSKAIMVEPYENIYDLMVQFIANKGIDRNKAEELIKVLPKTDKLFELALKTYGV